MDQQHQATMQRLSAMSGETLDHGFLEEMSKHHQMAIQMTEKTKFKDAELRKLAQKMAASQTQELGELKKQMGAHKPVK